MNVVILLLLLLLLLLCFLRLHNRCCFKWGGETTQCVCVFLCVLCVSPTHIYAQYEI